MDDFNLAPVLGTRLRQLRKNRGLSLERLSKASSVSRAMLGQIELGHSVPTVNVLWKISRALEVPVASLISEARPPAAVIQRAADAKQLINHDATVSSRELSATSRPAELHELRFAPGAGETISGLPSGTAHDLVVARGILELEVGGSTHVLNAGDAISFDAEGPHSYRNIAGIETLLYRVTHPPKSSFST